MFQIIHIYITICVQPRVSRRADKPRFRVFLDDIPPHRVKTLARRDIHLFAPRVFGILFRVPAESCRSTVPVIRWKAQASASVAEKHTTKYT